MVSDWGPCCYTSVRKAAICSLPCLLLICGPLMRITVFRQLLPAHHIQASNGDLCLCSHE